MSPGSRTNEGGAVQRDEKDPELSYLAPGHLGKDKPENCWHLLATNTYGDLSTR